MIYILIIIAVSISDLLIKNHIEIYYLDKTERYMFRKFIRIHKLNNRGGFLNYLENHFAMLKILSTILIAVILVTLGMILPKKGNRIKKTGLSLILGGALSNEYDRYTKGSVTDYFSVNLPFIRKIVFNIGDLAIFAGIIMGTISHHNSE